MSVVSAAPVVSTDMALLISSIFGLLLIVIGILTALLLRKISSKNNKEDMEIPDINNSTQDDMWKSRDMGILGRTINDSVDNEDQYDKLNDGLFKILYPQLASYNIFNSSPEFTDTKPISISIKEITSDEERHLEENTKYVRQNYVSVKNNAFNLNNDSTLLKNKRNPTSIKDSIFINCNPFDLDSSEEDQDVKKDHEINGLYKSKIRKKTPNNILTKISNNYVKTELQISFEEGPNENLRDLTLDSEEDSDMSINSKISQSLISENSNEILEKPIIKNYLNNKSPPKYSEEINEENVKDLSDGNITKLINLKEDLNYFSIFKKVVNNEPGSNSGISNTMSERVDWLQKDISTFLQQSLSIDENIYDKNLKYEPNMIQINSEKLQNKSESEEIHRAIYSTSANLQSVPTMDMENISYLQDFYIRSAGDNMYQDELLRDSSETTTSTFWPRRNNNDLNVELLQRIDTNSESINNQVTLSSNFDAKSTGKPSDGTFPLKMVIDQQEGFRDEKSTIMSLPTTSRNFKYIDESVDSEESNYNYDSQNITKRIKNENQNSKLYNKSKSVKSNFQDLNRSQNINNTTEFIYQTNRNASSDGEKTTLSKKSFHQRGNVKETVKLFENASRDTKMSLRVHKKYK